MKKRGNPGDAASFEKLRTKAEDVLKAGPPAQTWLFPETPSSLADALRLLHELQVQRIELEMQNDELVAARAELEQAVALYSQLYDSAPVGYFTLSGDGTIRQANLTAARLLGVERPDLATARLAAFVAPADRAAFAAALVHLRDARGVTTCEVVLTRTNAVVELTLSTPAADEYRVIAVDVTARKRAEEDLRTAQKMEAIGRLAGGVAHDFNNLLTVILSHTAFALEEETRPDQREDLQTVENAAKHAADLTRQLLAFSRKQVLRPGVVDVNKRVTGLATMLRRLLGEDIRLERRLAKDARPVEIDPVQLEQIVMNLTINARDAMPDGGHLTIATWNLARENQATIPGLAGKSEQFVVVAVSDTGTGMDERTMAQIFEPFFTTKGRERGTGFGLATVYGIVKQCGGDIHVASEPGRGTTFEVYLPCAPEAAVAEAKRAEELASAPQVIVQSATGGVTILVVEDEPALRAVTRRILTNAGYAVLIAATGEQGLDLCRETPEIRLVLSDVVMTTMNGVVFAQHLKKLRPDIEVLHMSGYTEEAIVRHGGIDPAKFIAKPFTAATLTRKVHEVLANQSSPRLPGAQ